MSSDHQQPWISYSVDPDTTKMHATTPPSYSPRGITYDTTWPIVKKHCCRPVTCEQLIIGKEFAGGLLSTVTKIF